MAASDDCKLMDENGIYAQIGLLVLTFGSLMFKRSMEYPKRSSRIFTLDVSK